MFSFTDSFCPSIEKQIEESEGYLSIIYDARDRQECCVCEHFCPPSASLPGFVTDYGSCKLGLDFFPEKVCGLSSIECGYFEYDETEEKRVYDKIKELKSNKGEKTMSDAKRCDRCKGYYDLGSTVQKNGMNFSSISLYDNNYNQLKIKKSDQDGDYYFDLCPECALKLLKWMHNEEDLS